MKISTPDNNIENNRAKSIINFRMYAPRWIVFMIDLIFSMGAVLCASFFALTFRSESVSDLLVISLIIIGVRAISFLVGRTYSGIVRYTGIQDISRIFFVLTIGEVLIVATYMVISLLDPAFTVPVLFFWVEYSVLLCLMVFSRLVFKMLFASNFRTAKTTKNVIVYGNSEYLTLMKSMLQNRVNMTFSVKAFMEPDERSVGKYLSGVRIVGIDALEGMLASGSIDNFILASRIVNPEVKRSLIDICMKNNVQVQEIPTLEKLVDGTLNYNQLRNLNLEDLLSRDPIQMDNYQLKMQLKGRVIFVTGAAGSIGSEIVRQLVHFEPERIVLIDIAETPLYDIELELIETLGFENFNIEMSDVRDYDCMDAMFQKYRPDIVYHAAAYKHVPMIEKKPLEGVKTNIFGTKNVADLAVKYGCSDFVMVSTDKAVNPTNVMGCTKRIAEIYTQSLDAVSETAFITTRFGNVLGSNGSVILRFARQIEHGGPVTVTHPEITRFFMTIPEACQLVLQAGTLGRGGEIFVFDMGECVKVDDLARRMITLSGYQVGRDIKIVYTGLRPGEKLYEEVLSDMETVLPTPHKRINRAKVREYDVEEVRQKLEELRDLLAGQDEVQVVQFMKLLVPEYKSQNSVFEAIDNDLEKNLGKSEESTRLYMKRVPGILL